ncbi:MAG TPA: hypothetical protein VE596_15545 [Gaiellaceae bacterium]|jgi:hypothetical protein|nr:hypothetical protein [Gaiellaceae bacterium]
MDGVEELIAARREEAVALFTAGRQAVGLTDRILAVSIAVIATAASGALGSGHAEVFLAAPPAFAVLVAYLAMVYADVAAMGAARQWLEREMERELGAQAFIYESRVRPIREGSRNWSIPAAQAFLVLAVIATAIIGLVIAVDQPAGVLAAYVTLTTFGLAIAALAVADLLRTYRDAAAEFGAGPAASASPWAYVWNLFRRVKPHERSSIPHSSRDKSASESIARPEQPADPVGPC